MKKLFVSSLPWKVTDQILGDMFAKFGTVLSAQVIMDRDTGRSRGFGFVEMDDSGDAEKAIAELNNSDYEGRKLVVKEARPRANDYNNGRGGKR